MPQDRIFVFVAFVICATAIITVQACKCKSQSTKDVYCQAKWISHVNVTEKKLSNDRHTYIYVVKHLEVYKKPEDLELPNEFTTPTFSGACGISVLKPGEDYLIAGTIANGSELRAVSCLFFNTPNSDLLGAVQWTKVPNELQQMLKTKPPQC